jgi:cytochrome c biogenesis protein CcdA
MDSQGTPGATGQSSEVLTTPGRGAVVHTQHMSRSMKAYPLYDIEIKALAVFSTQSTVCFSAGSSLLFFGIGILVSGVIQGTLSPAASVLVRVFGPLLVLIGLGVLWLGWRLRLRRESEMTAIMSQAVQEGATKTE